MNTPTTKITRCALALDINTALEIETKNPDVAMDFMQTARNDPRFMDFNYTENIAKEALSCAQKIKEYALNLME